MSKLSAESMDKLIAIFMRKVDVLSRAGMDLESKVLMGTVKRFLDSVKTKDATLHDVADIFTEKAKIYSELANIFTSKTKSKKMITALDEMSLADVEAQPSMLSAMMADISMYYPATGENRMLIFRTCLQDKKAGLCLHDVSYDDEDGRKIMLVLTIAEIWTLANERYGSYPSAAAIHDSD